MKFTTLTALVASASAGFPGFDSFHAHCQFETTVDKSCAETYTTLQKVLTDFSENNKDPARGFYSKKEEDVNKTLWYTRLTSGKKYTDDMEYLFTDAGSSCKITGKSRSQSLSYYDYQTNYCNIYNPLRVSGLTFSEPSTSQCKYPADPKQREAQCDAN